MVVETLERRLLPTFDTIEEEARSLSEEAWESAMSEPSLGDVDPSEIAEAAQSFGIDHYMLLDSLRQGMINLYAAALYHVFEQQVFYFHRKEVLDPREASDSRLFTIVEFRKRLQGYQIDINTARTWARVDELRIVANAVKHAEGPAARELRTINPALFKHPALEDAGFTDVRITRVYQPLTGQDIYVTVGDIKKYRDGVVGFWRWLADTIAGV
jgi:hypothetical protein